MAHEDVAIARMANLIQAWKTIGDARATFLSCYQMMTENMLAGIDLDEFHDSAWVDALLHRFADYYFWAQEAYDQQPKTASLVWEYAFDAMLDPEVSALQKLVLGVNAHINYDLVLSLFDLLAPEWAHLSQEHRLERYQDHCHVNKIIGRTIDAVQDQVIEPAMPGMDIVDKLLGRLDEMIIERMIANWRESVWRNAMRLLDHNDPEMHALIVKEIEADAMQQARIIRRADWRAALGELL